ncbi:mobile element protein [Vibrio sp. JCM 19236]|nr:mobile element protein [Vibrio sp. JCM 19236]
MYWKDYKAVTTDLKHLCRSTTEDEESLELERIAEVWDGQYPQISKSWRNHWQNLNTLINYS